MPLVPVLEGEGWAMSVLEEGRKDDADKPRYDLMPDAAEEEVVKVLTFGAKKYADDNWRKVTTPQRRYFAAARRHLRAWRKGEFRDPQSKCHHLAHAICSLMFILELELGEDL